MRIAVILLILSLVGCGGKTSDTVAKTKIGYVDDIYVDRMEFEGRSYHVFNGGHGLFVIDITEKAEK